MFFLYLAVMITGLCWAVKLLGPEFAKSVPEAKKESKPESFIIPQSKESLSRLEKLEVLLVEKNKNINLLQNELKVFYVHVRDSNKIKTLLEEEIQRLREQNRIFRSELGLPSLRSTGNSMLVSEAATNA